MAQLGARLHGMEEVKGSNPFRSTKLFKHLAPTGCLCGPLWSPLESKLGRRVARSAGTVVTTPDPWERGNVRLPEQYDRPATARR